MTTSQSGNYRHTARGFRDIVPVKLRMLATLAALAMMVTLNGCGTTKVSGGAVSEASGAQAAAQPKTAQPTTEPAKPKKEPPTWGKRYTWPDGLAIEVSAPATCKPGKYAYPPNVQRAVKFTITIINGTDTPYETAMLSIGGDAQFAGKKAEPVFDSGGACADGGLNMTTVLPGKTFTYEVAYAVGPEPGEMQLLFQPDFDADKAAFVGQA